MNKLSKIMPRLALISDFRPDELEKIKNIVSDRYVSKYIIIQEVNNVYACLLKDEDLYNIYNKRTEQAIAKMQQEVGFSNDKIKEIFFDCFE